MKKNIFEGKYDKKSFLPRPVLISFLIIFFVMAALLALCICIAKRDLNHTTSDVKTEEDIKNDIKNGINYTEKILLNYGFTKIDINNVDMNKELINDLVNLEQLEVKDKYVFGENNSYHGEIVCQYNKAILKYYGKNSEIIKSQTIDNVKSMRIHDSSGSALAWDNNIFLITYDGIVYELNGENIFNFVYGDIQENNFSLFEKIKTENKFIDIYGVYNYTLTSGAVYNYIGETVDGSLVLLKNDLTYNKDTYKFVGDNVLVLKNRYIYFDGKLQSFKYKFGFEDLVLKGKIKYILSDDDYLYDDNLKKVYNEKVISAVSLSNSIILIYSDGKNELLFLTKFSE